MSLVFDKVGRGHAEGRSKLSNGAAVGFYLVTLDSDYGVDADPGFVRQLLLCQELTLAGFPYFVADSQHGEHCSEALTRWRSTPINTPKYPTKR